VTCDLWHVVTPAELVASMQASGALVARVDSSLSCLIGAKPSGRRRAVITDRTVVGTDLRARPGRIRADTAPDEIRNTEHLCGFCAHVAGQA
jgi:hypothetical protein